MSEILADKRRISMIAWNTEDGACYAAKSGYEIKAYGEPMIHNVMSFFTVEKDGVIVARVPAWQVSVYYAE